MDKLTALRQITTVVADTGDLEAIKSYQPQDATTNPSLIIQVLKKIEYQKIINEAIIWANKNKTKQVNLIADKLIVDIGLEILKFIPGRISTEIDARLAYNKEASVIKARNIVHLYNASGINNDRILIKLPATWQGIKAAEELEMEGINCNLTLLFSFAQARACAEAGVFLVSPFVGRILDWYKSYTDKKEYAIHEDPGVQSVINIFNYYKRYGYKTVVMGASFRNIDQIIALAGCDQLTIAPVLLKELMASAGTIERKLYLPLIVENRPKKMSEAEFLWQHNQDPMAVTKLAEGIRQFAIDQETLETFIVTLL